MNGKIDKHESYGMISINRISRSGKTTLFGSSVRDHFTTMRIKVQRAYVEHHLGMDWYHAEGRGRPFVEIELSASQFAELLTSMNIGDGVPCTVLRAESKSMEPPPDREVESQQVKKAFGERAEEVMSKIDAEIRIIRKTLAGRKPIKVADRERIAELLTYIEREVRANMPFAVQSFEEATEKMVVSAKAEVDAFVTHAIQVTGLKALQKVADGDEPRRLEARSACPVAYNPEECPEEGIDCEQCAMNVQEREMKP